MAGMLPPLGLLVMEQMQRDDEGCEIPGSLRDAIAAAVADEAFWDRARIDPLYDALAGLTPDPELARREPDELAEIKALRPASRLDDLHWRPGEAELRDRMHGAWTGRAAGCAMGKPVEGVGIIGSFAGIDELHLSRPSVAGRTLIKAYLQRRDAWPLAGYIPEPLPGDEFQTPFTASCRENIAYMEWDDDIHYTLVGLKILEDRGPTFDWVDIATCWTQQIPFGMIFTAEMQAILNVWNHSAFGFDRLNVNTTPATVRAHRNPFREWIGARIRSDGWALAAAGKPELAAEFAWRDAAWTHTRNGVYSAMMFAAMQAAAFVENDSRKLIEIGLGQIPARCRLARAVRECLRWCDDAPDFEACMQRIEEAFPGMSTAHAINNSLVCVISLWYGAMDATESMGIAVMCGLDTDCNGATVGSITGASAGRAHFTPSLSIPLNDRILARMASFNDITMTELARRHAVVWHRVDDYHRNRND
jgi:ADP-ribosylglycohydrolase